jgi:hypothetical protein
MASTLMNWERKILRKIYGSKCEQEMWRIRSNLELQNAYKSPDIITEIKIRKMEWLGHIFKTEDTQIPKTIINTKLEGRCGVGGPKVRWLHDVEADIKALGIKRSMCMWVPCHHGMARPQVADGGDGLQIWRLAANILNKQSRTADKGWSSSLGVGRGAKNSSP